MWQMKYKELIYYINSYTNLYININRIKKIKTFTTLSDLHQLLFNSSLPYCRIYASVNRISIVSDNGMSPIRRKVII